MTNPFQLTPFIWKSPNDSAFWFSSSQSNPPKSITPIEDGFTADAAFEAMTQNSALLWQGDYHNGRELLHAVQRRLDQRNERNQRRDKRRKMEQIRDRHNSVESRGATFHQHRMKQAQRTHIVNQFLIKIEIDGSLNLNRAPHIADALQSLWPEQFPLNTPLIMSLSTLLGIIGAYQWFLQGVTIPQLEAKIHLPYGIFSPKRGEYLSLIDESLDQTQFKSAYDIGTGSGVIAALLAKKGVDEVIATDINPLALKTARENINRMGYHNNITIKEANLFPDSTDRLVDLIISNPPWIPAKPTSMIEEAIYDPDSRMLQSFLQEAPHHLNPSGEIWLIISNIAELLGLREPHYLPNLIDDAGLNIKMQLTTQPTHKKVDDRDDPLHYARSKEITSLYRLTLKR